VRRCLDGPNAEINRRWAGTATAAPLFGI
jgi:hypothetical protein